MILLLFALVSMAVLGWLSGRESRAGEIDRLTAALTRTRLELHTRRDTAMPSLGGRR